MSNLNSSLWPLRAVSVCTLGCFRLSSMGSGEEYQLRNLKEQGSDSDLTSLPCNYGQPSCSSVQGIPPHTWGLSVCFSWTSGTNQSLKTLMTSNTMLDSEKRQQIMGCIRCCVTWQLNEFKQVTELFWASIFSFSIYKMENRSIYLKGLCGICEVTCTVPTRQCLHCDRSSRHGYFSCYFFTHSAPGPLMLASRV